MRAPLPCRRGLDGIGVSDWLAEDLLGAELAVMDILAPVHRGTRIPVFEWGHETTPSEREMRDLVRDIVRAVSESGAGPGDQDPGGGGGPGREQPGGH